MPGKKPADLDWPQPTAKPFLKWVGGKSRLLPAYRALLPRDFGRYFEPFMGGGALFFKLQPREAYLTDINRELVDCYRAIQKQVGKVIEELHKHRYDHDYYYEIRDLDPTQLSLAKSAARTIYLNKTGFNGLYRVNSDGRFNVPFGRHSKPLICNETLLRACSKVLRGVTLDTQDFAWVADSAKRGDFVYFDPPYVPLSPTAAFTDYSVGGFGLPQQTRLKELFVELDKRGVQVMLSNSDTALVRKLYSGYHITALETIRLLNSNTSRRSNKVGEVVVRNFG